MRGEWSRSGAYDEGSALWAENEPGGDVVKLLGIGDPAPGTEATTTIDFFFSLGTDPGESGNGNYIFEVKLAGPGIDTGNDNAVYAWSRSTGQFTLLAREGSTVSGTSLEFLDFLDRSGYRINDAGQFAIRAATVAGVGVSAEDDSVSWTGLVTGNTFLLAREGDPAPGTTNGELFDAFPGGDLILNSLGNVAFTSTLKGPGTNADNSRAIYAGPATPGSQSLVVRAGD